MQRSGIRGLHAPNPRIPLRCIRATNNAKQLQMTMTDDTKLPLTSDNPTEALLAQLREQAPHVFSEGKVDWDKLKATLGEAIDARPERYGLTWAGKAEAFRAVQTPSVGTLLPMPEESVNFDSSENLIIEGDNLEVLKLLQKSYHGKVKMIYIDPPYNTGNEFIYPDNYREGLDDYLRYSGQVSDEGLKQSTNTETSGRFHSKWLNMMYPRLFMARNLLRDDGVIFVSIDDNEVHNLRMLMNEVFGEENFVSQIVWQRSKKGDAKLIASVHEYIVCYVRNKNRVLENGVWRRKKEGVEEVLAQYAQFKRRLRGSHEQIRIAMQEWYRGLGDNDPRKAHKHYNWSDDRGLYFADNFAGPDDGRESRPRHDIIHPVTGKPCKKPSTGWRWDEAKTKWALEQEPPRIHFGPDEDTIPNRKSYLQEIDSEPYPSVFYRDGRSATLEVEGLIGKGWFQFPKNTDVMSELVELVTGPDDVILDFFAGSGSTAHAVLNVNQEHGSNRRFVIVQLPEPTGKDAFPTIAHITRKRVRQAIAKLNATNDGKLDLEGKAKQDRGFRSFKLSSSNFKIWDADRAATEQQQLAEQLHLYADNLAESRTQQDVLYELILKSGLPLTAKVETQTVAGKTVHSIADGNLLICLENPVTQALLRGMMALEPLQILCLDAAFHGNDPLKTNAVLEAKSHGITFRTV